MGPSRQLSHLRVAVMVVALHGSLHISAALLLPQQHVADESAKPVARVLLGQSWGRNSYTISGFGGVQRSAFGSGIIHYGIPRSHTRHHKPPPPKIRKRRPSSKRRPPPPPKPSPETLNGPPSPTKPPPPAPSLSPRNPSPKKKKRKGPPAPRKPRPPPKAPSPLMSNQTTPPPLAAPTPSATTCTGPSCTKLLDSLYVDYCGNHVKIARPGVSVNETYWGPPADPSWGNLTVYNVSSAQVTVTLDKNCGTRWRSIEQYGSGVYSAELKTSRQNLTGFVTSLYLSTEQRGIDHHEIDFEFVGNDRNRVQTNYYVEGVGKREVFVFLNFDPSAAFHTYTIDYRVGESITWLIDGVVVRKEVQGLGKQLPYSNYMRLLGSLWDASFVSGGLWAGVAGNYTGKLFEARYRNIRVPAVTAPLPPPPRLLSPPPPPPPSPTSAPPSNQTVPPVPPPPVTNCTGGSCTKLLDSLYVDYCGNHVKIARPGVAVNETYWGPPADPSWGNLTVYNVSGAQVTITLDKNCGTRWRSIETFGSGVYSTELKTSKQNLTGFATTIYLSSQLRGTDLHEIDFFFLGNNMSRMLTNYYVEGVGGHEKYISIGFNPAADFHKYTIDYKAGKSITWLIDDAVVRYEVQMVGKPLPYSNNMRLLAQMWEASFVNGGSYAGVAGNYTGKLFEARYRNIMVPALTSTLTPLPPSPSPPPPLSVSE